MRIGGGVGRDPGAAQPALEPLHGAVVGLVIVAQAVEEAVEEQHPELALGRVPGRGGLAAGGRHRDQDVAHVAPLGALLAWEGDDVGRRVLAAELVVDPLELAVAGEARGEARGAGGQLADQPLEPGAQAPRRGLGVAVRVLDCELGRRALCRAPPLAV